LPHAAQPRSLQQLPARDDGAPQLRDAGHGGARGAGRRPARGIRRHRGRVRPSRPRLAGRAGGPPVRHPHDPGRAHGIRRRRGGREPPRRPPDRLGQSEGEAARMTVQENVAIPRTGVIRRLFANPFGAGSAVAIGLIVLIAVIAPLLPLPSPNAGDLSSAMQGPGPEHWLGTDTTGRDFLRRLSWGARVNLLGAALAVFAALVLGVPLGIAAGYYRGWVDSAAGWINDLVMALPGIIVLLAVSAVIGPSIWTAMAIFGVMLAPAYFRIVRASVLAVRGALYVDAAVVAGLSDARILSRHVVAVARAPLLIDRK